MLTALQEEIAEVVFASARDPELALAGGAALISLGIVNRTTVDLDFFTTAPEVRQIVDAMVPALEARGLVVRVERETQTFVRLAVSRGSDVCQVDVARDYRLLPAEHTSLGPVLQPEELAADKTLALFARAEPRDYVDVYFLAQRVGKQRLLELARQKDLGFDIGVFAQMLGAIERLDREEFDVDDDTLDALRSFIAAWRAELSA